MDKKKLELAPDEVTIQEAADILEIPADWVVAKIDSGLFDAYIYNDSSLVRLRSLIPCVDKKPTSLQAYYLDTRIPHPVWKPYFMYCEFTLADETNVQGDLIDSFDKIRILKKDLLKANKPVKKAATLSGARPRTPDVTGRRGILQQLLFDTLTDYFSNGKVLEQGSAFRTFLKFLDDRYTIKPRPDYMFALKGVDRKDLKACLIWMEKGRTVSQSKVYIEKEFSKVRKEFTTNI